MQAVGRVYCFGQRRCVHILRFGGHVCKRGLRITCMCAKLMYMLLRVTHRSLPFLDLIHRRFEQESPYHTRGTIIRNAAQILLQLHATHVPTPDTAPLVVVDPGSLYVRCQTFLTITRLHCPSDWSTCGDQIRDSA